MRGWWRVFAAVGLAALPLAGCSLFVDTSGLFGANPDERDDGATLEASADAPGADSGTSETLDARVDDGGCGDSPGRFCTRFDETDPQSRWTSAYKARGALAFDGPGLSAPNALRAQLMAGAGNGAAYLVRDLPPATAAVRCELDVLLEAVPTALRTEFDILNIVTPVPGSEGHTIYVASFDGRWNLAEYLGGNPPVVDRNVELGTLPIGRWFHVVLETTKTKASLTADGATVTLSALSVPEANQRLIQLGIPYASPSVGASSVLFDNVVCTYGGAG